MARKRAKTRSTVNTTVDGNVVYPTLKYRFDDYQKEYVRSIKNTPVTMVDAKSGTGKTTLAVYMGLKMLAEEKVDKIVYLRYVDDKYLQNGFLTGDLDEKTYRLFRPFRDALDECNVTDKEFRKLAEDERIELTTDTDWRGGNLKGAFLIIDEAQNAKKVGDLKLMLTRLHDENKEEDTVSRAVVIGHSEQQDNKKIELIAGYSPFQVYMIHMSKKPFTKICELKNNYRGEISQWADEVEQTIKELIEMQKNKKHTP